MARSDLPPKTAYASGSLEESPKRRLFLWRGPDRARPRALSDNTRQLWRR